MLLLPRQLLILYFFSSSAHRFVLQTPLLPSPQKIKKKPVAAAFLTEEQFFFQTPVPVCSFQDFVLVFAAGEGCRALGPTHQGSRVWGVACFQIVGLLCFGNTNYSVQSCHTLCELSWCES